jgi:hypothetical protein
MREPPLVSIRCPMWCVRLYFKNGLHLGSLVKYRTCSFSIYKTGCYGNDTKPTPGMGRPPIFVGGSIAAYVLCITTHRVLEVRCLHSKAYHQKHWRKVFHLIITLRFRQVVKEKHCRLLIGCFIWVSYIDTV